MPQYALSYVLKLPIPEDFPTTQKIFANDFFMQKQLQYSPVLIGRVKMRCDISGRLIQADGVCDFFPVLSTLSNIVDLFQKCAHRFCCSKTSVTKNRYFMHINNKSALRCALLLIPVLGNIIVALYDLYRSSAQGTTTGGVQGDWHRKAIILRELSVSCGIKLSDFLTLPNDKLEAVAKNNFLENAINAYIQIIAFLKTMLEDFPVVIWNPFCYLAFEHLGPIGQYIRILKKNPVQLQLEITHAEKIDSYWGNFSVIANFLEGKKEILSAMNWEQTPEMSEKCSEIEDLKGQLLSLRAKSYKVHLGTLSFEALFEEAKKYYLNSSDQKGRDSQVIENKTLRSIVPLLQTRVEENATSPHKKIEMYLIWERILEVEPYPLTPHLPAPSAEQKEKFRLFLT